MVETLVRVGFNLIWKQSKMRKEKIGARSGFSEMSALGPFFENLGLALNQQFRVFNVQNLVISLIC